MPVCHRHVVRQGLTGQQGRCLALATSVCTLTRKARMAAMLTAPNMQPIMQCALAQAGPGRQLVHPAAQGTAAVSAPHVPSREGVSKAPWTATHTHTAGVCLTQGVCASHCSWRTCQRPQLAEVAKPSRPFPTRRRAAGCSHPARQHGSGISFVSTHTCGVQGARCLSHTLGRLLGSARPGLA